MWETWVQSLGWEDALEEGMVTHSSILSWRIPMVKGAWWPPVHGVAKSRTRLSDQAQHSMLQIIFSLEMKSSKKKKNLTKMYDIFKDKRVVPTSEIFF